MLGLRARAKFGDIRDPLLCVLWTQQGVVTLRNAKVVVDQIASDISSIDIDLSSASFVPQRN